MYSTKSLVEIHVLAVVRPNGVTAKGWLVKINFFVNFFFLRFFFFLDQIIFFTQVRWIWSIIERITLRTTTTIVSLIHISIPPVYINLFMPYRITPHIANAATICKIIITLLTLYALCDFRCHDGNLFAEFLFLTSEVKYIHKF